MRKTYFFIIAFLFSLTINAQIINIPDVNFKAKLLEASTTNELAKDLAGNNIKIDINNNGEIEQNEALLVYRLFYTTPPPFLIPNNDNPGAVNSNYNIADLTGIEYFTNLQKLDVSGNQLTSLNISALTQLNYLNCTSNNITSLNINGLVNMVYLDVSNNNLTSLNLSGFNALASLYCFNNNILTLNLENLQSISMVYCYNSQISNLTFNNNMNLFKVDCSNNVLTSLDFSNTSLYVLHCLNNPNLNFLNIKNGITSPQVYSPNPILMVNENSFEFANLPSLDYLCHDEGEYFPVAVAVMGQNINIGTYCSFVPGGTYYTIQGANKFDSNNDGCDIADSFIPNMKYTISNGSITGQIVSDTSGNYNLPVQAGTHIVTPVIQNPSYFTVFPANIVVNFPTQSSPLVQNFCITPNGAHPDLEITLLPISPARPGFDAVYNIVYKNKGNTMQSGTVNLTFEDDVLDFVSANPAISSQSINNLSWSFVNLMPFESRQITLRLNVNSPMETPAVNNGDVLDCTV